MSVERGGGGEVEICKKNHLYAIWLVVWNIFYFHSWDDDPI
jgi:hypothetical protein